MTVTCKCEKCGLTRNIEIERRATMRVLRDSFLREHLIHQPICIGTVSDCIVWMPEKPWLVMGLDGGDGQHGRPR